MSLNKKEIRVLKLIDANVRGNHKANVTSYLRNQLGLPNDIANKIYALWVLNFRKDGKYEEIEEVNRDTQPILNFLKKIQQDEMDEDDIPERFFGRMNFCKGSYGGYYSRSSWNTPCVSIDSDNVTFRLGHDFGEYREITGLYSDDAWMYSEAHSNYSDYYDEYDSEEFNYVNFNDETLELVKKIAVLTKNNEALNYLNSTDNVDSERLARYLENMLHDEDFDYIVNDYISEIGYITGNERRSAVRDYYGEAITYPLDENDGYAIEIPIEDVIEKIEDANILSFDELAEVEFQDSLDFLMISNDQGTVHLYRNNVTIIFKPMLKNESRLRIEWRPTVISDDDLISLWNVHEELVDAWSFYGAITEFVNNKIKDFNLRMYGYNE